MQGKGEPSKGGLFEEAKRKPTIRKGRGLRDRENTRIRRAGKDDSFSKKKPEALSIKKECPGSEE